MNLPLQEDRSLRATPSTSSRFSTCRTKHQRPNLYVLIYGGMRQSTNGLRMLLGGDAGINTNTAVYRIRFFSNLRRAHLYSFPLLFQFLLSRSTGLVCQESNHRGGRGAFVIS